MAVNNAYRKPLTDREAVDLRNKALRAYTATNFSIDIEPKISFKYRVIGRQIFRRALYNQLKSIMNTSRHGKRLLK